MTPFYKNNQELGALPAGPFNDVLTMERRAIKDGMVSVDRNLYSVPNGTKSRQLRVEHAATELRILDEENVLAVYPLLLGKNQRQVIPGHRAASAVGVPIPRHATARTPIERAGDSVTQRTLDIYEVIVATLAKEGQA